MRALVRRALELLGIKRLVLAVHDASLPADARDDLGRGAPLSLGGREFLRFAAELGFDGIQLGPQGQTSEFDASPYNGTIFSRNTLSIAPGPLVEEGLLSAETLAGMIAARPPGAELRANHRHAHVMARSLLDEAWKRKTSELDARCAGFATVNADWLERDVLYAALAAEHARLDWLAWPQADREDVSAARRAELLTRHGELCRKYRFAQFLADRQHAAFHAEASRLGLRLYGDLQIGVGHQDIWSWRELFFGPWRMGAPPSRTNPEGQPWNYGVLDLRAPGPALAFVRRRVGRLLAELDGLRIDHPHGLIDPWVYRGAKPDLLRAVQGGARLFSAPDLPEMAALAIAEIDQLDRTVPRFADGWVRTLRDEQVARYAVVFDEVVQAARDQGREVTDLIAEVLSTLPYPVGRVLQRHGLGRFRVTQKAGLDDPRDVYRSENAAPADWIMTGNHDTESIWAVAERWLLQGKARAHADYLAGRLLTDHEWVEETARDPLRLAGAKLAELFVGPASHVMIFFTDLLGLREVYNRPGAISDHNWSLRVPPDYQEHYRADSRAGRALSLPRALAAALRARGLVLEDLEVEPRE